MVVAEYKGFDWLAGYDRLLRTSNLDPLTVLSAALPANETDRPVLLSLAEALAEPDRLRQLLIQEYPYTTEPRLQRAGLSVLHQDLALSVIAPLTLRLFRDGRTHLPDPSRIFLTPPSNANAPSRWLHLPAGTTVGVDEFVAETTGLLNGWYPVFRKSLGVSPGAYWSSVALALAAPFSAVWNLAEPPSVCTLAQAWLEQFDCDSHRYVDWIPATFNGQQCAIPQRRGCCLKYLLPDGGYCGTCGIYRKARMDAACRPSRGQGPEQWQPGQ
ncbi:MAG: (2Fe-2S)-binding protein [Pseudomonadota bacterium]|nr:(2Fe-2S)-binding protein [Pseudomonadota bacterium]